MLQNLNFYEDCDVLMNMVEVNTYFCDIAEFETS